MDSAAFLWTLAATFAAGIQIFSQKVVAQERGDSALNGIFGYGISALAALSVVAFSGGVPEAWGPVAFFGAMSGIIHGLGSYIRIESLKNIDSVIYFPINKVLGPIIVVALGVAWFGDSLSIREYIGIGLSLSVPLLLISAVEQHRQRNLRLGVILLIVSTALTAFSTVVIKAGIDYNPSIFFMMVCSQGAGTIASILIYVRQRGEQVRHVLEVSRRDIELGLLNGGLQFVSYVAFLKALSLGMVSLVYVIHAHYILIPIILSVLWYKEHINARKLVAVVISCLAIGLLYKA